MVCGVDKLVVEGDKWYKRCGTNTRFRSLIKRSNYYVIKPTVPNHGSLQRATTDCTLGASLDYIGYQMMKFTSQFQKYTSRLRLKVPSIYNGTCINWRRTGDGMPSTDNC